MIIKPIILCGGSGSRLWPLSREQYPKQLLNIFGDKTLLQSTALRLNRLHHLPLSNRFILAEPLLVGNEEYRFLLAQQMKDVGFEHSKILLEPCGRNTAPALTLAALTAKDAANPAGEKNDPILVVMPSDHLILDESSFCQAIGEAALLAEKGALVTFGISPTNPETGYGYIQMADATAEKSESLAKKVTQFVEKPDLETAKAYVESGLFLWNSGIFVFRTSVWLAKISEFRADIFKAIHLAYIGQEEDKDFIRPNKMAFETSPSDSIDYAVMEKLASATCNTGEVLVIPLKAGWSDIGAWDALWEIGTKDSNANVLQGDILAVNTHNTLAISQDRLIVCVGLDNLVVIDTPDALLVADKKNVQQVKEVVAELKLKDRKEIDSHRKVHRPWGWYDRIDLGSRFQVKRIVVKPGAAISFQMHHHRAEHWIVVSGTAKITKGKDVFLVSENESTFIPLGVKHRLENPGQMPLEIIEVQSGSYLGEDDIVRFDDNYGRN